MGEADEVVHRTCHRIDRVEEEVKVFEEPEQTEPKADGREHVGAAGAARRAARDTLGEQEVEHGARHHEEHEPGTGEPVERPAGKRPEDDPTARQPNEPATSEDRWQEDQDEKKAIKEHVGLRTSRSVCDHRSESRRTNKEHAAPFLRGSGDGRQALHRWTSWLHDSSCHSDGMYTIAWVCMDRRVVRFDTALCAIEKFKIPPT